MRKTPKQLLPPALQTTPPQRIIRTTERSTYVYYLADLKRTAQPPFPTPLRVVEPLLFTVSLISIVLANYFYPLHLPIIIVALRL